MTPVLVRTKDDCCGCKACANVCPQNAITFLSDKYGFEYPSIDSGKCIECGKCIKACDFKKSGNDGVAIYKPLEGYAARHLEKDVYANSTSGGVFTALAQWVLERDGFVFGCVFDDDMKPVHVEADNIGKVASMRGSKYVQSDVGCIYKKVKERLDEGKWALFTGTPCQVAGLYSYLGNKDKEKLLAVDIVCHGVPSALVFRKYIDYLGDKYHKKVNKFQFRNKLHGWERPTVVVGFEDGSTKYWSNIRDLYYEAFNYSLLQRPSCFQCKYATSNRVGDITIGDFWGWQKANIQMSAKEGVSCCLLNTEKAKDIFSQLHINTNCVTVQSIIQGNYHLRGRSKMSEAWKSVMDTIVTDGFAEYAMRYRKGHLKTMAKLYIKRIVSRIGLKRFK